MHTFIDGKPLITEDIPVVVYTDDDSSLIRAKIGLLREKIPQVLDEMLLFFFVSSATASIERVISSVPARYSQTIG